MNVTNRIQVLLCLCALFSLTYIVFLTHTVSDLPRHSSLDLVRFSVRKPDSKRQKDYASKSIFYLDLTNKTLTSSPLRRSAQEYIGHIARVTGVPPRRISVSQFQEKQVPSVYRKPEHVVPHVVHYINIVPDRRTFPNATHTNDVQFFQYVSYRAVAKFIQPALIFLWGDAYDDDNSTTWRRILREVPNIYHVPLSSYPTTLFRRRPKFPEHLSDAARIGILHHFGGIYLDNDVIPVTPLDGLLTYPFTLGESAPGLAANSLLLAAPGAAFLRAWAEHYACCYVPWSFTHDSCVWPWRFAARHPGLVRVVPGGLLDAPGPRHSHLLYEEGYGGVWRGWRGGHAVHLYDRRGRRLPAGERELGAWPPCALRDVMRWVLYDGGTG